MPSRNTSPSPANRNGSGGRDRGGESGTVATALGVWHGPIAVKRYLPLALRIAVTLGLLVWIAGQVDPSRIAGRLAAADLPPIALAVVLALAQWALAALRWHWILARLGHRIDRVSVALIHGVGNLFNQVLPSTVGGDVFRVALLARRRVGLGAAMRSVVCDRVFGTLALIVLTGLTLPLGWAVLDRPAAMAGLSIVVAVLLAGFALTLAASRRVGRLPWIGRQLGPVADDLRGIATSWRGLSIAMAFGLPVHALSALGFLAVAHGLGVPVTLLQAALLVPPVMLLSLVPLSIGGWGVREGGFAAAFALAGGISAADAVAVSIGFGLTMTAVAALGGLAWVLLPAPPEPRTAPHANPVRPP